MKRTYFGILCAALLLGGCSSKSNFYQLHTSDHVSGNRVHHVKQNVIGVAEVEVAEYLDQPQIVTRLNEGRVNVHEEDRWAGSFPKNIQTVLTQNLSKLLPSYTFLAAPWEEPISDKHRIYLSIERFDGDRNGTVVFDGRWSLVDKEENRVVTGERIRYVEQGGMTLDDMVATQSRLLDRLSRSIAKKVRNRL